MDISEDTKQRIKVCGIFLLQIYKITTGTMMSLFIPQSCGDKMCSLTDNYENNEVYHKLLFYWNTLSLFSFLICYGVELRREEWCVKYLDIDNNFPDNSLKEIIVKEKVLDNKMDTLNKYYYHILLSTSFIYLVNMLLTIKMIKDNYHGNSTVSCFTSFSLLVLMKLYNSFTVAYQSVKNDKMMSAYMCEFVSFNVLDNDYVKDKYNGKKNNRLEDIYCIEDNMAVDEVHPVHPDDVDVCDDDEQFKDANEFSPINHEEIIPIIN